eukprot:SAG25_NODE_2349_length_1693_cov_2.232748_2_plen_70_part_00
MDPGCRSVRKRKLYQGTFIWIEFWGASRSFAPQANFFIEHSRYTLGEKIPLRTGGRNAPQAKKNLLSRL